MGKLDFSASCMGFFWPGIPKQSGGLIDTQCTSYPSIKKMGNKGRNQFQTFGYKPDTT
jgi:hypothetical protein